MVPLVKPTLSLLRVAVQASLFLEAQRVLLRLLRPARSGHLARAEERVLSQVRTPLQHRWIPDARGNLIHVLDTGDASRPPVVLLHGHSMSAAFWCRNVDDLVSLGYRVIALDLLGWGRSQRPRFCGKTAADSVDWYLSSFAGVVTSLGLRQFMLVGHSLGAYLSMEYTKRTPDRVTQLVLVSPAASTRQISLSRAVYFSLPPQRIARRGGLLGFLLFVAYYPRTESYVRDRLRDYTYHLATQWPPSGDAAVLPIIQIRNWRRAECVRPLVENLELFRVPVQLVVGGTDSSMPVEGVHELYAEMKRQGFRVKLAVVERADHCPQIEEPEDFFQIMASLGKAGREGWKAGDEEGVRVLRGEASGLDAD